MHPNAVSIYGISLCVLLVKHCPMAERVPVSRPYVTQEDIEKVSQTLARNEVSGRAPVVREFESDFAGYLGTRHSVSCCNGTAALHLAIKALHLDPGDSVIVPTFTMMSPVFALLYEGLNPVLVDVDPKYWVTTPSHIRGAITPKTKAILVVHTYGNVVAMDEVMELARKHDLYVIEDCAEALGGTYLNRKAGTFGDVSTFSFFANKLITCGEGGMVCTRDEELSERVASYRDMQFGRKNKFLHDGIGYNYRLSALQAALGVSQLKRVEEHLGMIRTIARIYNENLSKDKRLGLHTEPPNVKGSFWMYSVVLDPTFDREAVTRDLSEHGVETRPFFIPAHMQPAFKKVFGKAKYGAAEQLSRAGLNLPSGLSLSKEEINLVCEALTRVLATRPN